MARDFRIDSIKGLLIILVILGHFITGLDNSNVINHGVMGCIYVFHMPLFILISGYFTKHPSQLTPHDMWQGVGKIFLTLVIFHLLNCVRFYLTFGSFTAPLCKFPYSVLWYLLCLIYWRILLYYTPRSLLNKPALYLGLALLLSLASGFFRLGMFLSFQRAMSFYFFFLLGFYYRQGPANVALWHNNKLHALVAVVLMPLIFYLYPHCGFIMNGADYYGLEGLPAKVMIMICSIAISLLVFNLMRDVTWLRPIGKDSLFFYVYHMFIVLPFSYYLVQGHDWPTTLPFILLYTAFTVGLLWLMSKVKAFRWLVNPTIRLKKK